MTSLGASRRHPYHPRSMTRPCLPLSRVSSPSGSPSCRLRLQLAGLNQLVPVLKGAAAVSATWQPCLYLASIPPRTLATSSLVFLSLSLVSTLDGWSWPLYPPPPSLSLFLPFSLSVLCVFSLGDINNVIAQAPDLRVDGSNDV